MSTNVDNAPAEALETVEDIFAPASLAAIFFVQVRPEAQNEEPTPDIFPTALIALLPDDGNKTSQLVFMDAFSCPIIVETHTPKDLTLEKFSTDPNQPGVHSNGQSALPFIPDILS
ncbi:MAG: hypothetical protein R3E13_10250 [Alphaproteobacteria bacterium]